MSTHTDLAKRLLDHILADPVVNQRCLELDPVP